MNFYFLINAATQEVFQADGTWVDKDDNRFNPVLFTSRKNARAFKEEVLHLRDTDIVPQVYDDIP